MKDLIKGRGQTRFTFSGADTLHMILAKLQIKFQNLISLLNDLSGIVLITGFHYLQGSIIHIADQLQTLLQISGGVLGKHGFLG